MSAILILPFTVTVAIPAILLSLTGIPVPLWGTPFPIDLLVLIAGLTLILSGSLILYITIRLFATVGKGTLAPWEPPKKLVVEGIYRYVRNPMITGVFSILIGESLLCGSIAVMIWSIIVIAINLVYIPLLEEPGLEDRFGEEYRRYKQNVPRWIPRIKPWYPSAER
ncbi:methyltransferase family protein [Methanooceanicella nereidis]|nr:isoprenylcysteine carboxylmethyltransferase family protein [Methanocella sp. CWC-04]